MLACVLGAATVRLVDYILHAGQRFKRSSLISLSLLAILALAPSGFAADESPVAATSAASESSSTADLQQPSVTSTLGEATKPSASENASRYLNIPVMYMTDRQMVNDGFGNKRKVESESIYDVYCGRLNYCLYNNEKKDISDARKSLGWEPQQKYSKIACESPQQPSAMLDKFADLVMDTVNKSGQKEIYIFIHGFNNTFDSAAKSAALLAYHVERPVILYSWPSTAKLLQYFVDAGNNEWSQEHYNRLVEMLYALKEKHDLSVTVVAHSMGNRLVVRAAPVLEGKRLFDKAFLVDPDFDSQTFLHYVARYAQKKEMNVGGRMRILFSHRDNALPVAQMLFGGYTRLGQGADTIFESLFNPKQMVPSVFQGTKTVLGLNKYVGADNNEGAAHNLFRKELEWIDFTVLDHGMIGHSIPYGLIASLSRDCSAGHGLTLVPVKVGYANLGVKVKVLNRFLGQLQTDALGICERVEFADKVKADEVTKEPPLAEKGATQSSR